MSNLRKKLEFEIPLGRKVERQPEGKIPAYRIVPATRLQVEVEAKKNLGCSLLASAEERFEVKIKEVFELLDGGSRCVTELLGSLDFIDKLYAKLLPLVAEEFEGKAQEVAA